MFWERGFTPTSLADIPAAASGVPLGYTYHHFKTKADFARGGGRLCRGDRHIADNLNLPGAAPRFRHHLLTRRGSH